MPERTDSARGVQFSFSRKLNLKDSIKIFTTAIHALSMLLRVQVLPGQVNVFFSRLYTFEGLEGRWAHVPAMLQLQQRLRAKESLAAILQSSGQGAFVLPADIPQPVQPQFAKLSAVPKGSVGHLPLNLIQVPEAP